MPSSDSAGSTEYLDAISDIADIVGLECLPVTTLKVAFHCGTLSLRSMTHGMVWGMLPTVQPPSPAQKTATKRVKTVPLAESIHKLHDIIFQVTLPKTKTAKSALITVDALHAARDLVAAACASLQEGNEGPTLKDISNQLESITARLTTPSSSPPTPTPQCSYASALTTGFQPPTLDASPLSPSPSPPPPPPSSPPSHPPCLTALSHADSKVAGQAGLRQSVQPGVG